MDASSATKGAVAAKGPPGLSEGRGRNDACDLFTLKLKPDKRRPDGDAADKAAGAVDGIDDPAIAGRAAQVAKLFTEKTVAGK